MKKEILNAIITGNVVLLSKLLNKITGLTLNNAKIGDNGVKVLAEALKFNKTITWLNLCGNNIANEGAKALADALKSNQTLTWLNLWGNNIRSFGATLLADSLVNNSSLSELCFVANNIGDIGAKVFGLRMLEKNSHLNSLILINNNINIHGLRYIAKSLKRNYFLIELALGSNNLGDKGAEIIVNALKENRFLAELFFRNNNLSIVGIKAFAELLRQNTSLISLVLEGNNLGSAGGKIIADALEKNYSLTCLSLGKQNLGNEKNRIDKLLKRNQKLRDDLLIAAQKGNINRIKELLDKGVSVFAKHHQRRDTMLHIAVRYKQKKVIEFLFNKYLSFEQIRCLLNSANRGGSEQNRVTPIKITQSMPACDFKKWFLNIIKQYKYTQPNFPSNKPKIVHPDFLQIEPKTANPVIFTQSLNEQNVEQMLIGYKTDRSLRSLDLSNIPLTKKLVNVLCDLLRINTNITKINLSNTKLTNETAELITNFLLGTTKHSIKEINLTRNKIHRNQIELISSLLKSKGSSEKPKIPDVSQVYTTVFKKTAKFKDKVNQPGFINPIYQKQRPQSKLSSINISKFSIIAYKTLTIDETDKDSILGKGNFGVVYKGIWQHNLVAIKKLHMAKMTKNCLEEFKREARLMNKLRHPQILPLYGVCIESGRYSIVMQYMPKGSLYDVLHDKDEDLKWPQRWKIALDVGKGILYLHSKNILHRDLKSLNVLMDMQLNAKLSDFGLSVVKQESRTTTKLTNQSVGGTIPWMAPELFKRKTKYTKKCDIYSYGIILWEISTRETPWKDALNPLFIQQWVVQKEREDIPENCPPSFAVLITKCWSQRAEDRPTIDKAVKTLLDNKQEICQYK